VNASISRAIVLGLVVTIACFMPIGAFVLVRAWRTGGIDVAFALFLIGELALTVYLFRLSTGAWYNYAVQAVVFASILVARALARAVQRPLTIRAVLGVSLAVVAVPAFALTDVKENLSRRRAESFRIEKLLARVDASSDALFFVDRPGYNRVHGRTDLVYDPWLYPVFESMKLAEPRSMWLARALEHGPVRVVVAGSPTGRIDGLSSTLPELGYSLRPRIGPWFVWTRQTFLKPKMGFKFQRQPFQWTGLPATLVGHGLIS
jgi:signal transduction histidine kinase